MQLYSDL